MNVRLLRAYCFARSRGTGMAEYILATGIIVLAVAGIANALPPILLNWFGSTIGSPGTAAPFAGG